MAVKQERDKLRTAIEFSHAREHSCIVETTDFESLSIIKKHFFYKVCPRESIFSDGTSHNCTYDK